MCRLAARATRTKSLTQNADPNDEAIVTVALVGEGAYDGLIALTEFDPNQGFGWAIQGLIVEADGVPAVPLPAQTY